MPANSHLERVTWLLVGVATALMQVALYDRDAGAGLPLLVVSVAAAVGLRWFTRFGRAPAWTPTATADVLALALLPLAWDVVSRAAFRIGSPYEVQLAYVLRNAMLALAATPGLPRATNHAVLAGFFLVVFAYLWSTGPIAIALLVIYALLGTWWLLAAYWDRLGGRFADSSESSIPLRPAAAAIGGLLLTVGLLAPLAGRLPIATTALAGFVPSSGGTGWNDPFAHGGVGDGDQMVAAKDNASSFGPIDSELFLESKMPSLYDTFNETSEAVPEKKKRVRRAIPLAPSQMQANHQKKGTTQKSTREFSTVRQRAPRRNDLEDRLSAALLLVKGRTPLHLALETYDRWDGRSLIAAQDATPVAVRLRDSNDAGLRWLDLSIKRPASVFTASGSPQVRVINLKTERVPTPAGAEGVTVTGLHSASMFSFADDGSLAMDVDHVPQLTIFEFRSALRDRSVAPALAREETDAEPSAVARLAAEWTRGVAAGWPQVEAILARLREDYTHDPETMVPAETADAVEHFLLESKRGPDYLFATSTAMLLRSLGYDTRVRSGFYASPERYDHKSRLTEVLAEDAHFWVEVRSQGGQRLLVDGETAWGVWLTLDPTPGYEVLYAPESLLAWLRRIATGYAASLVARPVTTGLGCLTLALMVACRRVLLDAVLIGWWSIRSRTAGVGGLARLTLRLLEWRAWVHHRRRPTGATLGRWEAISTQDEFIALAGWALYGAGSAAPLPAPTARAVCGRAIRTPFANRAARGG